VPHSTKPQYFLSFAVLGAIIPSFSVLLAERGLDKAHIGNIFAISNLAVIFTPLLITLLADTAIAPRYLMAALFALSGLFLAGLIPLHSFWPIVALYSLHMLALQPTFPLQDGIHFAAQAQRREKNLPEIPYHTVRVWGTIGYIVPGAVLYFILTPNGTMTPILYVGVAVCALGVIYAFFLPHLPAPSPRRLRLSGTTAQLPIASKNPQPILPHKLPTAAAARAMLEPHVLVFCIAMFLIYTASQSFYQFYPLHLTDRSHIDKQYITSISNIGVVGEIFFMLAFPWLVKKLTLRRVMYIGSLIIALRLYLLAAFPSPVVAIAIQLIHGMTVLVVHVAPPIFLDQRASNQYRNSIQGLYAMAFAGAGRVTGSLLSGYLAQISLALTFTFSATISLIATFLLYFAFHERKKKNEDGG
jgi:PPP family 3-phenylpropionic acid transporter